MKKLIVLLVLLSACMQKDKETKIFSNYLEKEFNLTIPAQLHYYVLIPKLGCSGCVQQSLEEIDKFITESKGNNFTVITTRDDEFMSRYTSFYTLFDKSGMLDALNLNIFNVCIVQTVNSKITFIKPVIMGENDNLQTLLKE